jgi:ParB family chromosome partitioning protein
MNRTRRGGLGRGLGALIPTSPHIEPEPTSGEDREANPDAKGTDTSVSVPGARFAELEVSSIKANPRQPRQAFDDESMAELAHSIREFGMLQPIVVREATDGYEVVMGERRLRAAAIAGVETVPAIVRDTPDDAMLRDALLENIHRTSLNPLEEAAAYQQLLEEFGSTHEELAQRLGRSRSQLTNTIRLLNLPLPVQRRVAAGVLSAGHARALLGVPDADQQEELATRIVAEGLSVRATEEQVALAGREAGRQPRRRTVRQRISAPGIEGLAGSLSDTFDTRVRVELGRRKGKITIEFASVDDLQRLVGLIAPQLADASGLHGSAGAIYDNAPSGENHAPNEASPRDLPAPAMA